MWCEENLTKWQPLSPIDEKIAELEQSQYKLCRGCAVDSIEDCYKCSQFERYEQLGEEIRKLENSKNK